MRQTEEIKENQKKQKEENEEVEKEIFFGQFEDDPANYVEIEKNLRANHETETKELQRLRLRKKK